MNKRKEGTKYEDVAADYMTENGYRIVERNFRCRIGEVDIIARKGNVLVFTEVKYRTNDAKGAPEYAVNYYKQKKIMKVCDYYRMTHHIPQSQQIRFDVCTIMGNTLKYYENAFLYG